MKGHFIGMFAQDKWRMGNNFTFSLGARYDFEILPTPNQENPLYEGDPDGYPMECQQRVAASGIHVGTSTATGDRQSAAASGCSSSGRRTRS